MCPPPAARPGRFRPENLFRPASVVVLGAALPAGALVLENLRAGGFAGPVLAAEPAEIARLPERPDLAVVCGDGAAAEVAFAALARRGVRAAAAIGQVPGLRDLARASGVRALGPGAFGVAVPAIGLNATTSHVAPAPGRLALVAQSAGLCRAVLDWAGAAGVGFSHVVGLGDCADLGLASVLDWLSRDAGTGTILLEFHCIEAGRAFLSAARAAARLRPVVALHAGLRLHDPSGAAEAALAAALRRCGVLGVGSLGDLLAAAETLARARPARGTTLAIAGNSRGAAWLAADAALRDGIELAAAPEVTADLATAAGRLAQVRAVGGVVVAHVPTVPADAAGFAALADASAAMAAPLLVAAVGETMAAADRRRLADAGAAVFGTPEQAVRGFLHLLQRARNAAAARELPSSAVLEIAPDRAGVRRRFAEARAGGSLALAQDAALAVLGLYGVPILPTRKAADVPEVVAAAAALGYPVVMKRRRLGPPAPGERGALALDLRDAEAVRDAALVLLRRNVPGAAAGLIVQTQAARGHELRLCVGEDAAFGPTLGFGPGGTAAEVFADLAIDLPPLNLALAQALIARTRVFGSLAARRDQPAADVASVADVLVRVSQLVVDFPEVAALEVNPLFADASGARAANAWILLRPAGAAPARLAIAPYPAELARAFRGNRETLLVRPIRPEDAEAHAALFARLSPEDVRYRFFSAMRELSPEQIVHLTHVDYEREIAFVAVREATGETVAVARLARESDDEAEFAVLVEADVRGQGLARHLMERLIEWARSRGIACIFGDVLADNAPMLGLVRRLNFTLRRLPDEAGVLQARLSLR